ncbi:MAG: BrxA family protein [Armatimonadota bacterium]|nr:DUF1819 family protein [bacterium]
MNNKRYTISICKGAGLLDETRTLLESWVPSDSLNSFSERVQSTGVLSKCTAYRTRDIVRRVFARRYLRPSSMPARSLKQLLAAGCSQRDFSDIVMLYACRNDDLLYDFVRDFFWRARNDGKLVVTMDDARAFLDDASRAGLIPTPWSPAVQIKIARGLLGALREFGMIEEHKRGLREIASYRPTDIAVAYLAYDLHSLGLSDGAVCSHDDWMLYGLNRNTVISRLEDLQDRGLFAMQHAGSVVTITWQFGSMEEAIDAIAERLIR